MKNFSGHHWTSKSIFSVLAYVVVTVLSYFTFRNPNIIVNLTPTEEAAFNAAGISENKKVFVFSDDGSVVESKKVQAITTP